MAAKRAKRTTTPTQRAAPREPVSLEGWFLQLDLDLFASKVLVWLRMPDGRWRRMPEWDLYPPFHEDEIEHRLNALFEGLGDGVYRFTPSVRGKLRGTYIQGIAGYGRGTAGGR